MTQFRAIFSPSHTEDHNKLVLDIPLDVASEFPAAMQVAKVRAREIQMHVIRVEPVPA